VGTVPLEKQYFYDSNIKRTAHVVLLIFETLVKHWLSNGECYFSKCKNTSLRDISVKILNAQGILLSGAMMEDV